jgi:small subunit ribosomal protein S1
LTTENNNNEIEKEEVVPTPETKAPDAEVTEENSANETKKEEPAQESATAVAEEKHDDFDWDMDNEGFTTYDESELSKLNKFYDQTFKNLEESQLVKGNIVSITDKDVVVNVGFKSDGIVPVNEFTNAEELAVGQEIELYVVKKEDEHGQLILSRRKARQEHAWNDIVSAMAEGTVLTGHVKSRTKGGLVVDIFGIDTFLPGSQIDIKPIRDYDIYVGKDMEFKVVKINEQFKNVVISHKALIEDDIEAQKSDILSKMEKGQVLEGEVKNMTSFGVFVDLGGVDGLLHITDISWSRISHPEEVLQLDQKINVVVLDFDDQKNRISLGLKQLEEHPWTKLDKEIQEGAKVKGKVVTLTDYGAFVEIIPGVEGLIHVSEMSWSQHLRNPSEFMSVGDEIDAMVIALDREEYKMSLGIKQLVPDPWAVIGEKFKVGSKHKGIVKNLTNYGVFVELEEGVDGLLHVSDLSWNKKINHPAEFVKKDEDLEVVVLDVDMENRRLSLGHKQLEENPWETFETVFTINSKQQATVTSVGDKGCTVQLEYGVEGFVPNRHSKKEGGGSLAMDEVVELEVIEFSKENRRVVLSHTNLWKEEEKLKDAEAAKNKIASKKRTSKTIKNMNANIERSTLGEMGGGLAELKAMMEKAETKPAPKAEKKAAPKKEEKKETKEEAPKAEKKAPAKKAASSSKGDDLKKINKIGPAFEKRLNALGINSYADLANLTDADIDKHEESDSMTSLEQWHAWIEEAKGLI